MILATVEKIEGMRYELLGLVQGNNVQTVNVFRDMGAGFKSIVGGELKKYNEMMANSRDMATNRMIASAETMGADAILGIRYTTSSIAQGAAEVMVYGTAIRFIKE